MKPANRPEWPAQLPVDMKYHPENHTTLFQNPIPQRGEAEDMSEANKLADDQPELVSAMKESLYAWYEKVEIDRLQSK